MSEIGLMLQKKSDWRYFCIMAIVAILSIIIIFVSACIQSSEPGDYYNQGIYYNNHYNQYDKALENFNKSVELEPGNPRVWFARSVALYNLKRYDESLESLNSTIAIDPDYGAAWFLKGDILRIVGQVNESEECLAKAKEFGYS
jgi:tetratricopeptide (TPR) repeat protein